MREIKFRGLADEGKWAYGMFVDGFIVNGVVEATDEYIAMENWWPVDIDTVGQYTGLKDTNGIEVYEGDILEHTYKDEEGILADIGVVKMDEVGTWAVEMEQIEDTDLLYDWLDESAKVTGNIHEDNRILEGKKMNLKEYQEKSKRTLNDELTKYEQIDNMVYGIMGEAGEVVDLLKKSRFQGHQLDENKLQEEIGDVMFYIANLCNLLDLDLEEIIEENYNKLLKRYPNGFSEEKSINREEGY